MGQVKLEVNGRPYLIACENGDEERIRRLGSYLDSVVRGLTAQIGDGAAAVGDSHLLVMAGLTIADELSEAYRSPEAARLLDRMAARLESVAAKLEDG